MIKDILLRLRFDIEWNLYSILLPRIDVYSAANKILNILSRVHVYIFGRTFLVQQKLIISLSMKLIENFCITNASEALFRGTQVRENTSGWYERRDVLWILASVTVGIDTVAIDRRKKRELFVSDWKLAFVTLNPVNMTKNKFTVSLLLGVRAQVISRCEEGNQRQARMQQGVD